MVFSLFLFRLGKHFFGTLPMHVDFVHCTSTLHNSVKKHVSHSVTIIYCVQMAHWQQRRDREHLLTKVRMLISRVCNLNILFIATFNSCNWQMNSQCKCRNLSESRSNALFIIYPNSFNRHGTEEGTEIENPSS